MRVSSLEKIISIPLVSPLGLVKEATISSDFLILRSLIQCLLNSYNSSTLLWVLEADLIPVLSSGREDMRRPKSEQFESDAQKKKHKRLL